MRAVPFLACLFFALACSCGSVQARVIRVAVSGSGGDGSTWSTALSSLGQALETARQGDEIWVASGTYLPSGKGREASFRLKPGVSVYGGFAGNEARREDRAPSADPTVLSGDIGAIDESRDNAFHVLVWANNAALHDLTVSGGFADGRGLQGRGAGLLVAAIPGIDASMSVANCVFSNNHAREGGAVFMQGNARMELTKCRFMGNTAENGGALLARDRSSPLLRDCRFTRNSARWRGGAVFAEHLATLDLSFCTFDQNAAGAHGGAVYAQSEAGQAKGVALDMKKCRLVKNAARGDGGGICLAGSARAALDTCVFKENRAGGNGGAVAMADTAVLRDTDTSFSGNWAEGQGNDVRKGTLSPALAAPATKAEMDKPAPAEKPAEPSPGPASGEQARNKTASPVPQVDKNSGARAPAKEHIAQPPRRLGPEHAAPPDPNRVIERFDVDNDGRISRDEAPMPMRMDWLHWDRNRDDSIEADELRLPSGGKK